MPTLAAIAPFGLAGQPTDQLLAAFARLGARTLQYFRPPDHVPCPADALRLAEDAGLRFDSIHGLFGPELDPSSPDPARRRQTLDTCRREAELALQLSASAVVVHPSAPDTADSPQRDHALAESAEHLARLGEDLGLTFLLENLPATYAAASPGAVARLIRRIGSPRLRMCFDTGHAHMVGDIAAHLQDCRDVIAYLHVHDNDARQDQHRIPGDGSIPWDALRPGFAALGPGVPAMLELFASPQALQARIDAGLDRQLQHWLA